MKDPEQIIAERGISNPSDATLVRLAGLAVTRPGDSADVLVGRFKFTHPDDAQVAAAIVESVRASLPATVAQGRGPRAWIGTSLLFAAAAIGIGVWSFNLRESLNTERNARGAQAEDFAARVRQIHEDAAKQVRDASATFTAAAQSSTAGAQEFVKTLDRYAQQLTSLRQENDRLKAEVASSKVDLGAARSPNEAAPSPGNQPPK